MTTELPLEGKVAVITGGSRGIGRAIALRFARAGAAVVLSSRKQESVQAVADEVNAMLGSLGAAPRAMAVAAHVGHTEEIEALVQRTVEVYGRVDIAVSNAATNPHFGPLMTADEGQWDKILDTNTKGAFRLCKAVVPHMQALGGGKILTIASLAGLAPSPGMGLYGISKAALIMLTQQLAVELGPDNIQVNAIAPGVIKTRFSQLLWQTPQIAEPTLGRLPLSRFGEPGDVAGLALFLASPDADYITGGVYVVDGGLNVAGSMG
jgi:NAD(P)-dependent dehydrogenase (short-subunit alcohol dehydrogenase family)